MYPPHINLGTLHILSPDLVPELREGHCRQIVTVWLRDFLNMINPSVKKPFLANLIRTTRLAMLFDRRSASNILQRIPCVVRFNRPSFLMKRTPWGVRYIVHDLIDGMRYQDPHAIEKGISFLKCVFHVIPHPNLTASRFSHSVPFSHMLERRLTVDIGVLCDFMDRLCGAIIIAIFFKKRGTLNGLALPRNWLSQLVCDIDNLEHIRLNQTASRYTENVEQLLRSVCTGRDAGERSVLLSTCYILTSYIEHLLWENLDLADPGIAHTRVVYFDRM